ncbi:MAG TPA: hypothetical protein VIH82_14915 [Acidimicrobiia bacterium]
MLRRVCSVGAVILLTVASVLAAGAPTGASAFPGKNGKIVFSSDRNGNVDIYVMDADGSDVTRLTTDPAVDSEPSWSADGKRIAFASDRSGNGDIYVMDDDGSDQRRLTTDPSADRGPSWSPDGEHIAFTSNRDGGFDDIFVMDDDGSDQRNVSNVAAPAFAIEPSWSPDGEHIAFSRFAGGDFEIYVMRPDGSGQTDLTNNPASSDSDATWSPDAERIAFTSFVSVAGLNEIFVMDADGTGQRNLTNDPSNDFQAAWSPDGEKIAFARQRLGPSTIFVMDEDGDDPTSISGGDDTGPNWQPREVDGDVTVTKWVNGTPPEGATYDVKIVCDNGDDEFTKVLTFGETGGTQTFERESFGPLECEVTETGTGGAATVEITCANGENAECGNEPGTFELFDDPGGDDTAIEISVTNTFPVSAEPTFTG